MIRRYSWEGCGQSWQGSACQHRLLSVEPVTFWLRLRFQFLYVCDTEAFIGRDQVSSAVANDVCVQRKTRDLLGLGYPPTPTGSRRNLPTCMFY